jgi:hypothetical protein
MGVPSRRNIAKSKRKQAQWDGVGKSEVKQEEVSPEEHEARVNMLKSLGLIK